MKHRNPNRICKPLRTTFQVLYVKISFLTVIGYDKNMPNGGVALL
jgi:hypothetical protein